MIDFFGVLMPYEELLLLWRYTNSECEKNTTTNPNMRASSKLKSKLDKSIGRDQSHHQLLSLHKYTYSIQKEKWFLSRIPILLYTSSSTTKPKNI